MISGLTKGSGGYCKNIHDDVDHKTHKKKQGFGSEAMEVSKI